MSKVWFVTGANSGIGAGIAKAALKAGDRVVATGRNLDKLRTAFDGVAGERLALVQLDVTDETKAQAAVAEAIERFGRIDVLINNAGYSLLGNFEELTVADFEGMLATNFYGVLKVMRAALPVMRKQRSGHVINISSVAGVAAFKHCSAYSASKFAVEGMSLAVAAEVEQFGIKLTVVEPGFFRTSLLDHNNARYAESTITDYASEGSARDMWSAYDGKQQGDPDKLGATLVRITRMENPPKIFAAGSDAVQAITPAVEERLKSLRDNASLSGSTDGVA
jgi:NAD(P)-dependent dehydrogenase (short-subunit alcohol dehydrogenase family)